MVSSDGELQSGSVMARRRRGRRPWGAVEKLPSGRFRARYTTPDGQQVSAPITFLRRREAEIWLDTQRTDIVREVWKAPRIVRTTVAEYVGTWIEEHPQAKDSTKDLYRSLLRTCIAPDVGTLRVTSLRPDAVRRWHHRLGERLAAHAAERRQELLARGRTPSTVTVRDGRTQQAQAYRLLKAAMRTAVDDGLISEQPCRIRGAGTPRVTVERLELGLTERTLTPAQVAAVAANMPQRYSALILCAAWSGLRQGELLALRRKDVSLDTDPPVMRVRRRVRRADDGRMDFDTPKSPASVRSVALPRPLSIALRAHLEQYVQDDDEALIFATASGGVLARSNLMTMMRRAMDRAGVPRVRFHDLRHTAQVLAAESGATLAELMARMGHSSTAAAQVYMHARQERDAELAERLGNLMDEVTVVPLRTRRPA